MTIFELSMMSNDHTTLKILREIILRMLDENRLIEDCCRHIIGFTFEIGTIPLLTKNHPFLIYKHIQIYISIFPIKT